MTEKRINIQRYAMYYGTAMGIYWILKFILFPLGLSNPLWLLLFILGTLFVPFLGFYWARIFRERFAGGSITFVQSWLFMVFMYLFASLLVAVAHYIYFRFIDNGYILDSYIYFIEEAKSIPQFAETFQQYRFEEIIELVRTMTPIEITMQLLSSNMLYCSILALITAPFLAKKKKQETAP